MRGDDARVLIAAIVIALLMILVMILMGEPQ